MQTRILIVSEADPMWGAGGPRQERGGGAAVQVIDNVITRSAQFPRQTRAGRGAVASDRDHSIDKIRALQNGRHPIFQENIYLCVRQKPAQRIQRGRGQNSISDRSKPHDQDAPDLGPIPTRGRQGLRFVAFRFVCESEVTNAGR